MMKRAMDRMAWVLALLSLIAGVVVVSIATTSAPADANLGGCVVGDICVAQRLVTPESRCLLATSTTSVLTQNSCTGRPFTHSEPLGAFSFRDDGTIRVAGSCLKSNGPGQEPDLGACDGAPSSKWTLVNNEIRDIVGQCLVHDGTATRTEGCVGDESDDWGLIPVDRGGLYTVRGVYIEADDSPWTGRSDVLGDSLALIQADWAGDGYTFNHDTSIVQLGSGHLCAGLADLESFRRLTIRSLSLLRQFDLNVKYAVVGECPVADAANADDTISVYAPWILTNAQAQLALDPNTAADGSMSEVGSFGHELGHSFGLNHENCIQGGWQGGIDEGGPFVAAGMPQVATKGPMCNGVYYPNVDPPSAFQRSALFQRSCSWFLECFPLPPEYGSDGAPYDCAMWSPNEASFRASDFPAQLELSRFTFEEGLVETYAPFSNQTGGSINGWETHGAIYLLKGVKNYFGLSLAGPDSGPGYRCYAFVDGPTTAGPDGDNDGIGDATDICPSTPAQTAVNTVGCGPVGAIARPDNDPVAAAAQLGGNETVMLDTVRATAEPGEAAGACWYQGDDAQATVWYKMQPTTDADVTIDTSGSDFDTQLAVWTATNVADFATFTAVSDGCSEDFDSTNVAARAKVRLEGGVTYYVQVDGWLGGIGELQLATTSTAVPADAQCLNLVVTIDMNTNGGNGTGTSGPDVILGTPGNDTIDGLEGDDTICGEGGDDTIVGGSGNDTLRGGAGNDVVRGGPDLDDIKGGPGDDRLLGGTGADTIDGDDGNDYIGGFGGNDIITGGPGNETIFGGFGADNIDGGPGRDNIRGLIGDDIIRGGDGDDKIFGDRGNDNLSGDDGNDIVQGGNAEDTVNGNDGDDDLSGGKRDDVLDGGLGNDVCAGNLELVADVALNCETVFGVP